MSHTIPMTAQDRRTGSAEHHQKFPGHRGSRRRIAWIAWIGVAAAVAAVAMIAVRQQPSDGRFGFDTSIEMTYTPVDQYHEVDMALAAEPVVRSTYTPVDPYLEVKTALATEFAYTPVDPYHEVAIAVAD